MRKKINVVNISGNTLDEAAIKVLEKCLQFVVVPCKIPVEYLICCVEQSVKNLPVNVAEEVKQESTVVLKRAKPPKSNISRRVELALKNLRNDENILVLKADKGNDTVVMDKEDYDRKMLEHIIESDSYRLLDSDPSNKILR